MSLPDSYIQGVLDQFEEKSKNIGIAKGKVKGLEEGLKILKNQLMKTLAVTEGIGSVTAQEREAYGHPSYKAKVDELVLAIKEASDAEYGVKLLEMTFEAWRTINANRRASGEITRT